MSESRQELWLIRHGETAWSAAKRHTGRTDIPLTPMGEHQAAELRQTLAGRRFSLVALQPSAPRASDLRTGWLWGCRNPGRWFAGVGLWHL